MVYKAIKRTLKDFSPAQVLVAGFAVLIFIGSILLTLPLSTSSGEMTNYLTALFTSTSAVCVTGLVVVDTGTYWSPFGQFIIICLIQIGGLGFMSLTTFFLILSRKKITIRNRLIIQSSVNSHKLGGIVRFTKYILYFTFIIEAVGAILLSFRFIPEYGILRGIAYSIFHAISAFCNAGFDIMGNYQSLTNYSDDWLISLTICALIIIGGLGFAVLNDIAEYRENKRLSVHSKFVLIISGLLIVIGTVLFFVFEYNNPSTLGGVNIFDKLLGSFFQSVTTRTAGFNTLPLDSITMPTIFMMLIFMFIGGSPGSTAGGIKTATIGVIVLSVVSMLRGYQGTRLFNRKISSNTIIKAVSIFIIALFLLLTGIILLLSVETGLSFQQILFEAVSAFGTVGLSMGITSQLSILGRIIIIITMFIGRLGPLTIAYAITERQKSQTKKLYELPEGKILVG
jgi:trk system potassium uptake protein TrkH